MFVPEYMILNITNFPRVLFVTRKWPPAVGGMENYSYQLTNELAKLTNLDILHLTGRSGGRPPTALSLLLFFFRSFYYLTKHRKRYDIVHFGDLVLTPLAWFDFLLMRSRKRVVTVHGLDIIYGRRAGFLPSIYRGFMFLVRKTAFVYSEYIGHSANTCALAEDAGLSPTRVVPLAVDSKNIATPNENMQLPENFVFFFGRVVKRKGLGWFLKEVLPLLPKEVVVVAAGTIWEEEELLGSDATRFQHLGVVTQEDLSRCCRDAICVVMPNISCEEDGDVEGFGLVAVEAAAMGAVVLAASTDGLVDAIKSGETGFLLTSEEASEWTTKINVIRAWSDEDRGEFVNTSETIVASYYNWQRVAQETLEAY